MFNLERKTRRNIREKTNQKRQKPETTTIPITKINRKGQKTKQKGGPTEKRRKSENINRKQDLMEEDQPQ
jgi:hypothetical protein